MVQFKKYKQTHENLKSFSRLIQSKLTEDQREQRGFCQVFRWVSEDRGPIGGKGG